MRSAALALVVVACAGRAHAADGSLAVMPFKNLNADASLDWLKQGIAETMIADLKKLGRAVVERDQLDRALAEVMLAENGLTEDVTAARAGKLVGARTVVVGGYQQAGDELRITARFVAVETGVVEGAAKATGKVANVFELQDEIVQKLAGAPTKPRKKSSKTLDAYRLYSMSLATSSDVDKVKYLKESVAADPDFTYAVEELRLLEARMRGYARVDRDVREQTHEEMRRMLAAADLAPFERAQRAMQLITNDMTAMRWRRVIDDCRFILDVGVPPISPQMSFDEMCSHYEFLAYVQLKRTDDALRQGERHLARYPGSTTFSSVKMQMQAEIDRRRQRVESLKTLDKELAEIEEDRRAHQQRKNADPAMLPLFDWRRCAVRYQHADYAGALDECARFLDDHPTADQPPDARELARYYMMLARCERGEFEQAREIAERLLDEHEAFANKMSLAMVMSTWPRD